MAALSQADHSVSPPSIVIPRDYNAAHDLIERNLLAGRGSKAAYIDDHGRYSYVELRDRMNRAANALVALGLEMESRVMLALLDTIDFPSVFLGAIKAGVIPVPVNTLLTTADYKFMLEDSRVRALIVSEALLPAFAPLLGKVPSLKHVIVSGRDAHAHAERHAHHDRPGRHRGGQRRQRLHHEREDQPETDAEQRAGR